MGDSQCLHLSCATAVHERSETHNHTYIKTCNYSKLLQFTLAVDRSSEEIGADSGMRHLMRAHRWPLNVDLTGTRLNEKQ